LQEFLSTEFLPEAEPENAAWFRPRGVAGPLAAIGCWHGLLRVIGLFFALYFPFSLW
jgi:hypothetical protein